jgi:DNA-binding protein H-NS
VTAEGGIETGAGGLLQTSVNNNQKAGYNYGEKKPAQSQPTDEQVKTNTEKQTDKVHGNSAKNEKPSGSYTNKHESGKTYSGKGDKPRMNQSAKDIAKKYNDPLKSQDFTPAKSTKDGYIQEHNRIQTNGGVKSNKNYNQRESPGKKLSGN